MVISQTDGGDLIIRDDGSNTTQIRSLPLRRWDGSRGHWIVPHIKENVQAIRRLWPTYAVPDAVKSGYQIDVAMPNSFGTRHLVLRTLATPDDVARCRKIPQYRTYSSRDGGWVFKPTKDNLKYVFRAFPKVEWSEAAKQLAMAANEVDDKSQFILQSSKRRAQRVEPEPVVTDYQFLTPPFHHQTEAFLLSRGMPAFALLMEQGTGKSKILIDTAADLCLRGKITAVLVVCPNSVKSNWEEEIELHLPKSIDRQVLTWEARTRHKVDQFIFQNQPGERPLKWLIMNVEALSAEKGVAAGELFISKFPALMVVDESSRIKTPSAARTKKAIQIGRRAKYRRIMSGTPVTQGPLDLFTQFKFLDPDILGFSTFYGFRNRYAIMGGWNGKQVVAYAHLEELQKLIEPYSYRKLKSECLDLPEKLYEKRVIELTTEQRRLYDEMKDQMVTELDGGQVQVQYAITQIMRMQQIIGGFIPMETLDGHGTGTTKHNKPIPGGNPKLEALLEICDEAVGKVIIWARFRAELALIAAKLREVYGADQVVEFHGGVTTAQRTVNRRAFQQESEAARFFVGQPAAGGLGLTLTAAGTVVYYSNDYSLETRLQSEDRAHRIGQTKHVTYIDIMAKNTSDWRIVKGLRSKKGLADLITGDPTLSWL